MKAHRCYLCCAGQKVSVLRLIQIFFALRKKAGAQERLLADERRHNHRRKSFSGKKLHRVLPDSKGQERSVVLQKISAEARDLGAALKVEHVERSHDID